jgi:hypothetical protein
VSHFAIDTFLAIKLPKKGEMERGMNLVPEGEAKTKWRHLMGKGDGMNWILDFWQAMVLK